MRVLPPIPAPYRPSRRAAFRRVAGGVSRGMRMAKEENDFKEAA